MDPIIQEKLMDLIINTVSIILGGGIIVVIIELRRHKREQRTWKREDQLIEVDIPRSDLMIRKWQISDKMTNGEKLNIYENVLEGTVKSIAAAVTFVIRNTTGSEIVITSYDAKILQIPPGDDNKRFYDLESFDLISVEDIGAIKLRPYAAIARIVIIVCGFDKDRKLETVPTTLVVETTTSSGSKILGKATLNMVNRIPDLEYYNGQLHPNQYVQKLRENKDDDSIPF